MTVQEVQAISVFMSKVLCGICGIGIVILVFSLAYRDAGDRGRVKRKF